MRLRWATDIHLDHLDNPREVGEFARALLDGLLPNDAVVLTGDLSNARALCEHLKAIDRANHAGVWVLFVLGNHDYYGGRIETVRDRICELAAGHGRGSCPLLTWLGDLDAGLELAPDTAIVGVDGWYDARAGDPDSDVLMSDFRLIDDLADAMPPRGVLDWRRGVDRTGLYTKLRGLADGEAADLELQLGELLKDPAVRRVVVATHVPPWPTAAWHRGKPSEPEWQTFFVSVAVGQVLERVADAHPDVQFAVLCGHTHGRGQATIRPNLRVHTGAAEYGDPQVETTFDLTSAGGLFP